MDKISVNISSVVQTRIADIINVMDSLISNINLSLYRVRQNATLIDPVPFNALFYGEWVETYIHLILKLLRANFDVNLAVELCKLVALPLPLTNIDTYLFFHFDCPQQHELCRAQLIQ